MAGLERISDNASRLFLLTRLLHFIILLDLLQVMRRAHWDDEREVWVLERLSDVGKREVVATGTVKRPVSASGQRRPTADCAKVGGW